MSPIKYFPVEGDILISRAIITKINSIGSVRAFEVLNKEIFIVINVYGPYDSSDQRWKLASVRSAYHMKEFFIFPSEIPYMFDVIRCEKS